MDYIPNTDTERKEMLKLIGVDSIGNLFNDIPEDLRLKELLKLPKGLSELDLKNHLIKLSNKNKTNLISFLGAGAYNHFSPSVINHILLRSEFYTAYTPYQPEISQGMLQSIYEFQSLICLLTGMDVSNASLYDGASALAESCIMAVNITKKRKILAAKNIHPDYRQTVKTYCTAHGFDYIEVEFNDGLIDSQDLVNKIDQDTAAFLVQNPNFFGGIEDLESIEKIVHEKKVLLNLCIVEPTSLGILKSPSEYNVDIVVGEGQGFGLSLSFGGPYLGFIGTKKEFIRQMPGRIIGMTNDTKGRRGFVLTFQAREQHIRREKASSNICTNHALCALAATVHLSLMGKNGFREMSWLNVQKAHYAFNQLKDVTVFNYQFYNEFIIKVDDSKKMLNELIKSDILGGIDLGKYYDELKNHILICVTEMNSKEDIDLLIEKIKNFVK